MNRDIDFVRVSGERFVDRVVDDFVDEMMQPNFAGRTDIHRRPLAHGLHAAKNFDGVGGVIAITVAGNGFAIFYF